MKAKRATKANTVNVVIFAGGKFRENVGKTFHVGVIFTILLTFPSFLFSRGGNFREEDEIAKTRKFPRLQYRYDYFCRP